jgi:hypothetical protein
MLFYLCSFLSIQTNFYHWLDFYHDQQEQNQQEVVEEGDEAVVEV